MGAAAPPMELERAASGRRAAPPENARPREDEARELVGRGSNLNRVKRGAALVMERVLVKRQGLAPRRRRDRGRRRLGSWLEGAPTWRKKRGSTEKMLRPWSQQARQLTPRRGTVAHRNQGCCKHIHTGNLSGYVRDWAVERWSCSVETGVGMPHHQRRRDRGRRRQGSWPGGAQIWRRGTLRDWAVVRWSFSVDTGVGLGMSG